MYHFNHTSPPLKPSKTLIHLPPPCSSQTSTSTSWIPDTSVSFFPPFPSSLRLHTGPFTANPSTIHHQLPRLRDLWFRLMKVCISSSVTKPLGDFAFGLGRELVDFFCGFLVGEKKDMATKERHFQKNDFLGLLMSRRKTSVYKYRSRIFIYTHVYSNIA